MIDLDEAVARVLANVRPGEVTTMALREAFGCTLAAAVHTDMDHPPFDRAVMDGYAVRAADVAAAPVTLRVVGQAAAGGKADVTIGPGQAVQINTGAPVPSGACAVVRVEDTQADPSGTAVEIRTTAPAGQFITPRAQYVRAGDAVLDPGTRFSPLAVAAAAAAGAREVRVYRRPRVAILGTGDELVDVDCRPTGSQIRNSNQYLLEGLVKAAGAEAVVLGAAHDDRDAVRSAILRGGESDVLCITGGISMGAFDFVPGVLESLGARFHVHKIAIKPGRPTIFATLPAGRPVFALPGNPASAFVGFTLLVRPALAVIGGGQPQSPQFIEARLDGTISATRNRRTFLPACASPDRDGDWTVKPLSWHGSGDAFGMARADALIMRPPNAPSAGQGDAVLILPV